MKNGIDAVIIAAKPVARGNKKFVARTMLAVQKTSASETFESVLRKTNMTKKEQIIMKLKHLPTAALIALVIAGLTVTSAAAYAAYAWLAPKVTFLQETPENDDQKREYSVNIENCGVVVGGTPIADGVQRFEVVKDSKLTKEQVEKVLKDTCADQKLVEFSQKHWQPSEYNKVKKGQTVIGYGPFDQHKYTIGKVTAISSSTITIETTLYSELGERPYLLPDETPTPETETKYYPEGKRVTSTYRMAAQPEFFYNGTAIHAGDVRVGDTVSLQVRYSKIAQFDNDMSFFNVAATEGVVGVMKTDIDTAYVQSEPFIGDPRLVGQVFQLVGCDGSKQYLCISINSMGGHGQTIYTAGKFVEGTPPWEKVENGDKYFRTDIPENPSGYFHTVEGRILKVDGNTFTFYSRGKVQKISVELPYDVFAAYNKTHKTQIQVGDFVEVGYMQQKDEDQTKIMPRDIYRIALEQYQLPDGSYANY